MRPRHRSRSRSTGRCDESLAQERRRRAAGERDAEGAFVKAASARLPRLVPKALLARSAAQLVLGALADARDDADAALVLARQMALRLVEADAHVALARVAAAEGRRDAAAKAAFEARWIVHETGYHFPDAALADFEGGGPRRGRAA